MKKIILATTLSFILILVGCSGNQTKSVNSITDPIPTAASSNTADTENKIFTLAELKAYDGKNGNPAYVAVNGIIYDVTHAKNWINGKHESGVTAGRDLSTVIGDSPHGTSVLQDLPVVGRLQ